MRDEPYVHQSVLLAAVVEHLAPRAGAFFVDGTLGGGGHAEALLDAGCQLLGVDRDPAALAAAGVRLARFGDRFEAHHATFDAIPELLGGRLVDGLLLDLGVSSPQIDQASRGFSFRNDGPVDFRMDPSSGAPLSERLDDVDETELADVIFRFGEERLSRRVARAILAGRPFRGTLHLAEVVAGVVRSADRHIHPATRTFQGLRIWVNDELGQLDRALATLPDCLAPGGRLGIISFHSLEDRSVKHRFRELAGVGVPTDLYGRPITPASFSLVAPGGITDPSPNPRARSARLRILERHP